MIFSRFVSPHQVSESHDSASTHNLPILVSQQPSFYRHLAPLPPRSTELRDCILQKVIIIPPYRPNLSSIPRTVQLGEFASLCARLTVWSIIQVGRQRAGSLHTSSQGRSPRRSSIMPSERDSPWPDQAQDQVDEPDERTSFRIAGNTVNYQGTQTSASLRSRQPPPQPDMTPAGQNGNTTHEEKKHWLWHHFDGLWSIELENTGSVARDHLAVGMFDPLACSLVL